LPLPSSHAVVRAARLHRPSELAGSYQASPLQVYFDSPPRLAHAARNGARNFSRPATENTAVLLDDPAPSSYSIVARWRPLRSASTESWGTVRTSCPPVGVVPANPGSRRGGSASSLSCTSTLPCRRAWSVMIALLMCPGRQSKLRITALVCGPPRGPSVPTALSHVVERMPPSLSDRTVSTLNSQAPSREPRSAPVQAPTNARAERAALRLGARPLGRLHPSFIGPRVKASYSRAMVLNARGFVGQAG